MELKFSYFKHAGLTGEAEQTLRPGDDSDQDDDDDDDGDDDNGNHGSGSCRKWVDLIN